MKTKLTVGLVIAMGILAAALYNSHSQNKYRSQVILAKELHKAMQAMMGDLRQARTATVSGVPADGQWHHEIAFQTMADDAIEYRLNGVEGNQLSRTRAAAIQTIAAHIGQLNMRRQPADHSMIEVQLLAFNDSSLTSNFRIRMQD